MPDRDEDNLASSDTPDTVWRGGIDGCREDTG
jgi:hypothetical protein